ncbi:hypothetical protein HDU92_006619 [Lobulomyces angularis]|nr:hypothetical protein HDU92_006619 [Lobulomyces angularis]
MSGRGGKKKVLKFTRGGGKKFTPSRILSEQDAKAKYRDDNQISDSGSSSEEESSSEDETVPKSSTRNNQSPLIPQDNPNRQTKQNFKSVDLGKDSNTDIQNTENRELTRREREEQEKAKAKANWWKAQEEGKTEQARNDMARLAIIRKQREEAAKKKQEEKDAKAAASASKTASLEANKSTLKKRLG